MPALLLESSSSQAALILAHQGSILETLSLDGGPGLSQKFFASLMDWQERKLFSWNSLQYIGCGTGPGSFTGVRIAASLAQSFAYAHNLPLVSFCSLLFFVPEKKGPFAVALDAKTFGMYLLKGENSSPQVIRWDECIQHLSSEIPLFSIDAEEIQKKFNEKGIPLSCTKAALNPSFLAGYCEKKFLEKAFSSSPLLELSYLRTP